MRRKKRCSEPEPWRTMTYETHGDDWGSLSETPIFIHDIYIWYMMIIYDPGKDDDLIWVLSPPLPTNMVFKSTIVRSLGPFSGQGWLDLGFPGGEKPIAITVAINSYSYSHENSFNTYHWLWKLHNIYMTYIYIWHMTYIIWHIYISYMYMSPIQELKTSHDQ
jgi:hypothetical protein